MDLVIGTSADGDVAVDAQELVTGRTCIIAQSGAGKSWSIAVICEALCRAGLGFCLIDTEGEYSSLKDLFSLIWIGMDGRADYSIEDLPLRDVISRAVSCAIPVIYDVSEVDMRPAVERLVDLLYEVESELRRPYLLIVEEADKFIPQSGDSIRKIEEISRRGRKRGLGLLVSTQRPSLVTKNVLSQCNNQIIGKLSIENDLRAVDLFFGSRKEVEKLNTLAPGEFFVMGGLTRRKVRMRFRGRESEHRGATPPLVTRKETEGRGRCADAPVPAGAGGAAPASPHERGDVPLGIRPRIGREDALASVRSGLWPRSRPRVTGIALVYRPLVRAEIRYIGGLIQKKTKMRSILICGLTGDRAVIGRRLSFRPCFSGIRDLPLEAIRLLSVMPGGGATVAELEIDSGLSREAVEKALDELRERALVTDTGYIGDTPVYSSLLPDPLPRLSRIREAPGIAVEPIEGIWREPEITRDDLRRIVKGLEPTAEVADYSVIHYPLYEIEVPDGIIYLDGVTGKRVRPPGTS
ncbi:MAG: ATP-binding protein [Methanoculleaceae archaeon]